MKIIALSDTHGHLINIRDSCDVVVIAGDWSPLTCQSDAYDVLDWCNFYFIPWMSGLNATHVIFIPGNHDIACEHKLFKDILYDMLKGHKASKKIHYLCNSSIIIDGIKFYGTPNNESPNGWAFASQRNQDYYFDEDTDVLITHQPPLFGDVGYIRKKYLQLGSKKLRDTILKSNISVNICGHIHTGSHEEHVAILDNGKYVSIFNVSILDESYNVNYNPTVITL